MPTVLIFQNYAHTLPIILVGYYPYTVHTCAMSTIRLLCLKGLYYANLLITIITDGHNQGSGAARISSREGAKFFQQHSPDAVENPLDLVTIRISRFFPKEMRGVCGFYTKHEKV